MLIHLIWGVDWGFGVPMILFSLAFHVSGLVLLEWILISMERKRKKPRSITYFLLAMLLCSNYILAMHVTEATLWAALYYKVGALPDFQTASLYSLNALTSYGHENLQLKDDWRLLGAIESMNGVMIFGLSTAFLFNAMREQRPVRQAH